MGCSCSKTNKMVSQPRKINKPVPRVINKTSGAAKTIRRVLERY